MGGLSAPREANPDAGDLIELAGINKRFGATRALQDVAVRVGRGRVLGLVGENGAGKSTLGKLIAGTVAPDSGSYRLDGAEVRFGGPRDALAAGVSLIAQELLLVPARTVLENVLLGTFPARLGLRRRRAALARYAELEERVGFGLHPDTAVGDLRLADRQKVEILRAIAHDSRLLVMDEPTAALGRADAKQLLALIRDLAERGASVIFISHHLDEVLAVADDVTIMRDGAVVRSAAAGGETRDSLIEGMLGAPLEATFPDRPADDRRGAVVLSVEGLSSPPAFEDVAFDLHAGEILGLAGLVGAGRSELARCIAGAERWSAGTVRIDGTPVAARGVAAAIRAGIGLVPESRKEEGLVLQRSVEHNLLLVRGRELARHGIYRRAACVEALRSACDDVRLVGGDPARLLDTRVGDLSGGNQQKVMLAKWLLRPPRVLIIDEPTRGVDVGAKRAIYDVIVRLSAAGTAILLISSEIEEVLGLAQRVLVMSAGRISAELDAATTSEERVMQAAFAHTAAAA